MSIKNHLHSWQAYFKDFFHRKIWDRQNTNPRLNLWYAFLRVLIVSSRGFISDRCGLHASALTFITLISLVPILAIMLSFCKGIGMQKHILASIGMEQTENLIIVDDKPTTEIGFKVIDINQLPNQPEKEFQPPEQPPKIQNACPKLATPKSRFIHSLPSAMQDAIIRIFIYVEKTNFAALGMIGCIALLLTVILSIKKLEDDFNFIWGISKGRPFARQFIEYLMILLLLPIFILLIISTSSFVTNSAIINYAVGNHAYSSYIMILIREAMNFLAAVFCFTFLFFFMPNTRVRLLPALISGIVTTLLFGAMQYLYIGFQVGLTKYNAIYGTIAILPFFLALLYADWNIILLGCELSFAIQHNKLIYLSKESKFLDAGSYYVLALTIMNEICSEFNHGKGPWDPENFSIKTCIPLMQIRQTLKRLEEGNLILRLQTEKSALSQFIPARNTENITVADIAQLFIGTQNDDAIKFASYLPKPYLEFLTNNHKLQINELKKINFSQAEIKAPEQ